MNILCGVGASCSTFKKHSFESGQNGFSEFHVLDREKKKVANKLKLELDQSGQKAVLFPLDVEMKEEAVGNCIKILKFDIHELEKISTFCAK